MLKEKIRFQEIMHINDVYAIYSAIAFAERIVLVKEKLIYYRVNRPGSLMSTYGESADSVFEAYEQLKINLERHGGILDDPEILLGFRNKVLDIYIYIMRYCNTFAQYQHYYDSLRESRFQTVGLDGLEAEYIFNPRHAERYKNMYQLPAEDYLLWQYQTLLLNDNVLHNDFNRQKNELKTQKSEIKAQKNEIKAQKSEIKALESELKDRESEMKAQKGELKRQKEELKRQESELTRQKKELAKLEEKTKTLEALSQSQKRQLQLKSVRIALKLSRLLGRLRDCFTGKRKKEHE